MADKKLKSVCVTGAGGYLGSWVANLLLLKGYTVHGTVRDLGDGKYAHLRKLEKASENLKLFEANLLDYGSLCAAITGCTGVFHVASPVPSAVVPNPEVELIEPAVTGTLNVLKACSEANVKRVVVVSSGAAVFLNPSWPNDKVKDETCWSDAEYCRDTKNWYCLSKTVAESEAFKYAKSSGLDVVTVCPTLILGPMLQHTVNASSSVLIQLLKGHESVENKRRPIVDVRDVAEALVLVFENLKAEGRYICAAHLSNSKGLVDKLKNIYPVYNYPKNFIEEAGGGNEGPGLSNEKLLKLGWSYRPLEETLTDSVECYRDLGFLD